MSSHRVVDSQLVWSCSALPHWAIPLLSAGCHAVPLPLHPLWFSGLYGLQPPVSCFLSLSPSRVSASHLLRPLHPGSASPCVLRSSASCLMSPVSSLCHLSSACASGLQLPVSCLLSPASATYLQPVPPASSFCLRPPASFSGLRPLPPVSASGHCLRSLPPVTASGHCLRSLPPVTASGHCLRSLPPVTASHLLRALHLGSASPCVLQSPASGLRLLSSVPISYIHLQRLSPASASASASASGVRCPVSCLLSPVFLPCPQPSALPGDILVLLVHVLPCQVTSDHPLVSSRRPRPSEWPSGFPPAWPMASPSSRLLPASPDCLSVSLRPG
ncbi:hypothetical protein F4780DRAFT_19230 [Xylariomycetidae sp. FL0641]|nr:hypothetical protein F4780DRAFT_19230 [Xylariomycetidae sp. FL0641]